MGSVGRARVRMDAPSGFRFFVAFRSRPRPRQPSPLPPPLFSFPVFYGHSGEQNSAWFDLSFIHHMYTCVENVRVDFGSGYGSDFFTCCRTYHMKDVCSVVGVLQVR